MSDFPKGQPEKVSGQQIPEELLRQNLNPGEYASVWDPTNSHQGHSDVDLYQKGDDGNIYRYKEERMHIGDDGSIFDPGGGSGGWGGGFEPGGGD